MGAILSGRMDQHTVIARFANPRRERPIAPFVFDPQFIILVLFVGGNAAVHLSGDMNHSVFHREYMLRIVVAPIAFQEGVPVIEIPAIEQVDAFPGLRTRRL